MPPAPDVHHAPVVARLRAAGCVFAEDEAQLLLEAAGSTAELEALVARRVRGLPLEHVLGWADFAGLRVLVTPGVFVPRPRTELMVRLAIDLLSGADAGRTVLDLCCGSGAVGAAVAAGVQAAQAVRADDAARAAEAARAGPLELYAADVDPAAVACARRNLAPWGGQVVEGDLFAPLPTALRGRVDVLVANVPYVPTDAIGLLPPEARLHEPRAALDGGPDGLDVLRRVAAAAAGWLVPGGHLLVETSDRQAPVALEILSVGRLMTRVVQDDDLEATVVLGRRPVSPGG